ncbi:inheritance of peroxisomes protein 1-domain-containing protein [Corynascus novoguineensis]|uniref:Inheritance of peroxisomes protein 1 n=1 Tax=Corynascus novoguineensis TaxID=1126955 RepID=A0AAN7CMC3_9PEZI|nr:inheritance of peroxisomes protein 1-domain-containing protein [Corynascus novoguineensis]
MEPTRPRSSGFAAPRRVFTSPLPPSAPQPGRGLVDTLYYHPDVKIVSFTAGTSFLFNRQRTAAEPDIEPGSLPWSSQLERTIAVGPFSIYRAPGSVAFLSCGSALQPILPKSQVWCVDEESSKFVLQIRRPQYWRIEVPVVEEEDVRRAQHLREVFDAILQFEKTECPFQRPFTVELPERPKTPVKRRPWTPARRSSASLPLTPVTPVEIARLHEGTPRGSFCMGDLRAALETRRTFNEHNKNLKPPVDDAAPKYSDPFSTERRTDNSLPSPGPCHERPRSISAAPPLPKIRESGPVNLSAEAPGFKSPSESLESVHGRESWLPTPLPPSPPLSTPGSPRSSSQALHAQDVLESSDTSPIAPEHTVVLKPSQTWSVATIDSHVESECSTATAPSSLHDSESLPACEQQESAATAQPPLIPIIVEPRIASPNSRPASSSPQSQLHGEPTAASSSLSPTADLLNATTRQRQTPTMTLSKKATTSSNRPRTSTTTTTLTATQGALAVVRRLPMTVLHKTCEILMSPPSHLISLMLDVAARITAGEWRGLVFGTGEGGERLSVAWDWSDLDEGYGAASYASRGGPDDFWLRSWRTTTPPATTAAARSTTGRTWGRGKLKMAGAFPDSDEEDEGDEEEGEIGPLDRSSSPGLESVYPGKEDEHLSSTAAEGLSTKLKSNARKEDADARTGVD